MAQQGQWNGLDPKEQSTAPAQAIQPTPNPAFQNLGMFFGHPFNYMDNAFQKKIADPMSNAMASFKQGLAASPQTGGFCGGTPNSGYGQQIPPGLTDY